MRLLTDHAVFPITHMVTCVAVKRIYPTVQNVTHQSVGTEPVVLCESMSKVSLGGWVHTVLPSLNALKTNRYFAGVFISAVSTYVED